ncbi:hypothetical protein B0T18DRAFT_182389 [Schizothecium vesticola]|uniref:Uncharacterized protein n=1 Tax=Schizothecium vesticola TaxID=314040 RepID=A0AA40K295_9PEZI|nr:hypothetical protein B0T18DRAFT_182389 [Schizothecium vesticola]
MENGKEGRGGSTRQRGASRVYRSACTWPGLYGRHTRGGHWIGLLASDVPPSAATPGPMYR